jgi:CRISPR-associated endonuclease/helicase Cas3
MYLADRWSAALGQRGCYFALPTMATSNQMFGRVRDLLRHRYPQQVVNLQLLHGHALLSAELEALRDRDRQLLVPRAVHGEPGDLAGAASPDVVAAEWFTYRKRGLLAPFGVGTVDQGLLAALRTKHVFVRLFGLSHKVVVVDEVHAYDTYMTALLERLLEWLAALGASVVLLSATLPTSRRKQLAAAFGRGLGLGHDVAVGEAAYPRLTWVSGSGAGTCAIHDPERRDREVGVAWVDGRVPPDEGDAFPLGERLQQALAGGGCVAVICNTVRRAQQVYRALKRYFPGRGDDGQPELDLFHAQYLYQDREVREQRALIRFGKPGGTVHARRGGGTDGAAGEEAVPVRRPHRAVLVATQVVEQSLDLDFDLMVTDLAPADLVLQRSGRLHRHRRETRPPGLETPALWICLPERLEDDVPRFGRGNELVYEPHVLLRSWLALRGREALRVPGEIEALIESVYDDALDCSEHASAALRERWDETARALRERAEAERAEAGDRWLQSPGYGGPLRDLTAHPRDDDAPDLHQAFQALTRLAQPTAQAIFLYGTPDAPALDAEGRERLRPSDTPPVAQARRLLRRSATLSDPRAVEALLGQVPPAGWKKSSLLRHYRLLCLDEAGNTTAGRRQVRVDPELGLVVRDRGVLGA